MTQSKREQAMVGLFVLIAGALLVGTIFALGGLSSRQVKTYHAYFPFAGGVEPGTAVRYSGGPKVGRVEKSGIDPQDPSRIDVTFSVDADLPLKTGQPRQDHEHDATRRQPRGDSARHGPRPPLRSREHCCHLIHTSTLISYWPRSRISPRRHRS